MRDLHQDQRKYHFMKMCPKIGDNQERIDIESFWHSKGMLDELRDYEYVPNIDFKPKTVKLENLKKYNHLDTDYNLGGWAKRTKEREERENQWVADNYELITN